MDALAEIRTRLLKYPTIRAEEGANSITVLPMDSRGFPVSLHVSGKEFVVAFAGWHEHFSSAEDALNCFAFGLSEKCRLKVYKRGSFAYRWTVESQENGAWVRDSTTGLLFFPFWRRREVVHLQNRVLPANRPLHPILGSGAPRRPSAG
jgi:hypothetical protein